MTAQRKRILPKNRTLPYRLLTLLLYSRHPWIARRLSDDGLSWEVRVLATPLRMALGITNRDRLFHYLAWLEARGLVAGVTPEFGRVECRVPIGASWNAWDFPGWAFKTKPSIPGMHPRPSYHHLRETAAGALTKRQTLAGELVAVGDDE